LLAFLVNPGARMDAAEDREKGGSVSDWTPIETAPKEGQFLVYMPDEKRSPIQVAEWHPNVKIIGNHFAFDFPPVTHWMPLPDAPK
jgi:hypothetical protein